MNGQDHGRTDYISLQQAEGSLFGGRMRERSTGLHVEECRRLLEATMIQRKNGVTNVFRRLYLIGFKSNQIDRDRKETV
jgi:hypothetical protein